MIDFEIPAELLSLAERVRGFVTAQVVPYERDPRLTQHGPNEELRNELVGLARDAGLLTIQAPRKYGGQELSHVEQSVVYEAAGWSTLGPVAMNCAAPDEGNMFVLNKICTEEQAKRYLAPVIAGQWRSAFALTAPDGAGSDPGQLTTAATFDGIEYVINGLKWLITGANKARTWIIMARLAPNDHGPDGPTLFICNGDEPGLEIERVMNSMDRNYVEGHCVVRFDNMRLPAEALLGEAGQAFRYAQLRLAPARLTHCMRWLGAASRAQSLALEHAKRRTAFGKPLAAHQGVRFMLADNEIALQQCRLAIWHTAWV